MIGVRSSCFCFALIAAGCSGGHGEPRKTAKPEVAQASESEPRVRDLGPRATFSSLVAVARSDTKSEAPGCLLAGPNQAGEWYVGARFASPLRPLPKPPNDLFTQVMREGDKIVLLTQRGPIGSEGMTLVALTDFVVDTGDTASTREVVPQVLLITPSGVFHRTTEPSNAQAPIALDEVSRTLADKVFLDNPVYVTADAQTPIQVIAHILRSGLKHGLDQMGFALALPEGTRLPKDRSGTPSPLACQGDPAIAEQGTLPKEAISASFSPMTDYAQRCYDALPYSDQHVGSLKLRIVVNAEGKVAEACTIDGEALRSRRLENCLVTEAQGLTFPAPYPKGEVVFSAPLRFAPKPWTRALPICPAAMVNPSD